MTQTLEPVSSEAAQNSIDNTDIKALFEQVATQAIATKHLPGSTYRLQFNKFFTFQDARQQISYLHDLGITDIYASPYLRARPESLHGYDICDHNQLNPSIGDEEDYRQLVAEIQRHGMSQILDIVPNHMGIGETCNKWWMDVLENGPSSIYANYFDIDWNPVKEELQYKVLLPILGDQYGQVLERGELQIKFEAADGAFYLDYFEHRLPVSPHTYADILNLQLEALTQALGAEDENVLEYQSLITSSSYLPPRWETERAKVVERNREKEILKRRLAALCTASTQVGDVINAAVAELNGTAGLAHSFDLIDTLIEKQAYRVAFWRVAAEEINYRRFFDVNDMAAIRVELPEVYERSHALILRLVSEGSLQGLRVDHADGLWDPAQYLWRLQRSHFLDLARKKVTQALGYQPEGQEWANYETALLERLEQERADNPTSPLLTALYVVPEKILGRDEKLPENWTVDGTSGYDYLIQVNNLFVDSSNTKAIDDLYSRFINTKWRFADLVYSRKGIITRVVLASEINVLARLLNRISEQDRRFRDFTLNNLRFAIREVIACFPVYRTYIVADTAKLERRDQIYIERAVTTAKRRNPARDASVFDFLRDLLLLKLVNDADEAARAMQYEFVMKFQQVTGPVMAKGLEDTTFYIYNRLTSLDEVGGDPDQFGASVELFHKQNAERNRRWPHAMLTTSTHDTKRSEDVRVRIDVLSEIPRDWRYALNRWVRLNRRHHTLLEGKAAPDRNDEYLLYQTMLGVWPIGTIDDQTLTELISRLQEYMVKAMREAKVNTSWLNPNNDYETAVRNFVQNILHRGRANPFLADFEQFQSKTAHFGAFNSLSQVLLKITSPGVPDFYQGNELWDLSLVDPDNRRKVDYVLRAKLLAQLPQPDPEQARQLVEAKADGRIKLYVTSLALHFRNSNRAVFDQGSYQPLIVSGKQAEHVGAFARSSQDKQVIVAVPRLLARLNKGVVATPLGPEWWQGGYIGVPEDATNARFRNIFTGEVLEVTTSEGQPTLALEKVFANFPVALLERVQE